MFEERYESVTRVLKECGTTAGAAAAAGAPPKLKLGAAVVAAEPKLNAGAGAPVYLGMADLLSCCASVLVACERLSAFELVYNGLDEILNGRKSKLADLKMKYLSRHWALCVSH